MAEMKKGRSVDEEARLVYSTERGDLRKEGNRKEPSGGGEAKAAAGAPVRIRLDTKSRRGKAVTLITGIPHCPEAIEDLAKKLRTICGAGGTVEGHDILVQGDHRARVAAKLTELGYKVKII